MAGGFPQGQIGRLIQRGAMLTIDDLLGGADGLIAACPATSRKLRRVAPPVSGQAAALRRAGGGRR